MAARNEEDYFNVVEAFEVLKRQKWFMIWFFVFFMILVVIVLLIWPKIYVSESIVQLGSIGINPANHDIFDPVSAKAIIESKDVLNEAVSIYNEEMESKKTVRGFKERNLEVELVKEQVGRDERLVDYLIVKVKTADGELSRDINRIILENFLNYTVPYYEERLNVFMQDKRQTEDIIRQLNEDIASAQKIVNKASESASDNLLLSRTIVDSRGQLITSQNKLVSINADLASKREFKIVSEPEIPSKFSFPPVKLAMPAGIVIGVLLALALGFLRDELGSFK